MRSRWVFALLSALGCAGGADRPDARSPSESAGELRAELRRERRTIHTLENEVALLRARLRDSEPPPVAPPPDVVASAPLPADAPLPETLGAVPALGDEEVEVVYEGEAASEPTARPRIELKEEARSYRGPEPSPPPLPPAPVADAPGDRLPVLSGELPTVAAQMRRARAAPAASPRRPLADPRGDYQRYLDAARAGNHEYAAQGLRSFLDQHPRHDLADNAQYWLAETYYARKRYPLAAVEFEKVVERYPRGNKLPDALLKIGYCRAMAGKRAEAIAVLRRLVRAHPGSGPAALARSKLQELEP